MLIIIAHAGATLISLGRKPEDKRQRNLSCTAETSGGDLKIMVPNYTAGKISIEHVTISLSKGAVDLKSSPDIGNNTSNPYIQRKQNK